MKLNFKQKIIVIIIGLTVLGTIAYQVFNKAPQKWDSAAHVNLAMLYALKISEVRFEEIPTLSGFYPPLVHLLGASVYLVIPLFNSPLLLSFIFLGLGFLVIYKTSLILTEDKSTALFTVLIFSLLPQVYIESRLFQLDLPLTVITLASTYFIFKTNGFTDKKNTFIVFILMALAELTKWYAFVYLAVPACFEFFKNNGVQWHQVLKTKLVNVFLGLLIFAGIAAPWYTLNFKSIIDFFNTVSSQGELTDPQNPISIGSLLEYAQLAVAFQTSFIVMGLIIIGILYLIKEKDKNALLYTLGIIVPFLVFTLIKNKDVRYIMPLIPYYALILGQFLRRLHKNKHFITDLLLLGSTGYLIICYIFISFNQIPRLSDNYSWVSRVYSSPWNKYQWITTNTSAFAYQKYDWKVKNMFERLLELDTNRSRTGDVLFAVDFPYFNVINFTTLQLQNKTYFQAIAGYQLTDGLVNSFLADPMNSKFEFIISSFNPGETGLRHYDNMVRINRFLQQNNNQIYQAEGFVHLPNGEDVYIFRKVGRYF